MRLTDLLNLCIGGEWSRKQKPETRGDWSVSQILLQESKWERGKERTVRSSKGRASWMLESVAWRSFNSTSICASVSFALAIYGGGRAGADTSVGEVGRKGQPSEEDGKRRAGVGRRSGRKRTALVSKVSMAFTCVLTSYVTGLNSRRIFSASSTMPLFFSTER